MAIQAQAPIVPVAIVGARHAMKKGSPWIRPVTVSVRLAQPFETAGLTIEDRDLAVNGVRNEVARLLQE
jgi:1-acyl-sn-glycerol-3-phosphate acyltransferase